MRRRIREKQTNNCCGRASGNGRWGRLRAEKQRRLRLHAAAAAGGCGRRLGTASRGAAVGIRVWVGCGCAAHQSSGQEGVFKVKVPPGTPRVSPSVGPMPRTWGEVHRSNLSRRHRPGGGCEAQGRGAGVQAVRSLPAWLLEEGLCAAHTRCSQPIATQALQRQLCGCRAPAATGPAVLRCVTGSRTTLAVVGWCRPRPRQHAQAARQAAHRRC